MSKFIILARPRRRGSFGCAKSSGAHELRERSTISRADAAPRPIPEAHRLGLMPVIQDGTKSHGRSGRDVEYLPESMDRGAPFAANPPRHPRFAECLQWFHYGEATSLAT